MKLFLMIFVALTTICGWALAIGGGSDIGNGTDNPSPEKGSAWFLGEGRRIRVCSEMSVEFGVSQAAAAKAIEFSFRTWRDYGVSREFLSILSRDSHGRLPTFDFVLLPSCDGTEDLKFMFGSDDGALSGFESERAKFDRPTAFSYRSRFDVEAGWSKGVIWFANAGSIDSQKDFPKWSDEITLRAIVLHEVGHIYGVGHVRGTIMDADLSEQLRLGKSVLEQVDQRNQLVACWHCREAIYHGRLGYGPMALRDSAEDVFRRFVGRAASGAIAADFKMSQNELKLYLRDRLGEKNISLGFDLQPNAKAIQSSFDRGERIFKIAWLEKNIVRTADIFNGAYVEYGSIQDARGKTLNLILEVNSNSLVLPGPFTLRWLENGETHSLFFSER